MRIVDYPWVYEVADEHAEQVASLQKMREDGEAQAKAWDAAREAERAALDAELGPVPRPAYRKAKIAYSYRPSKAAGRRMALDCGFDLAVLGMEIAVEDPQDAAMRDREFAAGLAAQSAEISRRSAIVDQRLQSRGIVLPRYTKIYTLGVMLDDAGIDYRCAYVEK